MNDPKNSKPGDRPISTGYPLGAQNPNKKKRAIAQAHGQVQLRGQRDVAESLRAGFQRASRKNTITLTHEIHSYPARMHPAIARTLVEKSEGVVLDPFCGSGTVVVEALVAGRPVFGSDLNPLGLEIARLKTRVLSDEKIESIRLHGEAVMLANKVRVKEKRKAMAPLEPHQARRFAPNVLAELAGLYEEIITIADEEVERALRVVLSGIIMKFASERVDNNSRQHVKRIGKYIPSEHYYARVLELCDALRTMQSSASADTPVELRKLDARKVHTVCEHAGVIITSPPYGGTYDYVDHHALRMPFLGFDNDALYKKEIGARRRFSNPAELEKAILAFDGELLGMLNAMSHVLPTGGKAYLMMGDGVMGSAIVDADEQIERLSHSSGFDYVATASEERTPYRGHQRKEHIIALVRNEKPAYVPKRKRPKS